MTVHEDTTPTRTVRRRARRDAILEAAADAFLSRGYAATSIDDIADRLGASKGRVYHYFRTKGDIFVGIHRKALEIMLDNVRRDADASATPTTRLRCMAATHARLMMDESGFMRLAAQLAEMQLAGEGRTRQSDIDEVYALRDEYEAMFEAVISEGMAAGEFVDGDPGVVTKAVLGSLNWISVWYRPRSGNASRRSRDIAEAMADYVTRGVGGRSDGLRPPT